MSYFHVVRFHAPPKMPHPVRLGLYHSRYTWAYSIVECNTRHTRQHWPPILMYVQSVFQRYRFTRRDSRTGWRIFGGARNAGVPAGHENLRLVGLAGAGFPAVIFSLTITAGHWKYLRVYYLFQLTVPVIETKIINFVNDELGCYSRN